MKKLLFIALVICGVSSCFGDDTFSSSYRLDMTFEDVTNYAIPFGSDSLSTLNEYNIIMWSDPSLALFYKQDSQKNFQGGFRLSRLKGEADGMLTRPEAENDAWRVNAVGGAKGYPYYTPSKTYAVFFDNPDQTQMPLHDIEFGYRETGYCTMYGCYVNNTTLVARRVKEHFEDGDKLLLSATGYRMDGTKTGSAEIVLAEYSALKDTVMYNWTAFDLSKLGVVDFIEFEITSTKPEVPEYVCIDGIAAGISISY